MDSKEILKKKERLSEDILHLIQRFHDDTPSHIKLSLIYDTITQEIDGKEFDVRSTLNINVSI